MLETIEIPVDGAKRPFTYPPSTFMKQDIERVLSGMEYPLPLLDDFTPKVILDVGASVGMSSLYFHLLYPEAAIHAFEPGHLSRDCLAHNMTGIAKAKFQIAFTTSVCWTMTTFCRSTTRPMVPRHTRWPLARIGITKRNRSGSEAPSNSSDGSAASASTS